MDTERGDDERVLYGFWISPYMALVGHVLKQAAIPFRYERVSPFVGGTISETHTERNSLQTGLQPRPWAKHPGE